VPIDDADEPSPAGRGVQALSTSGITSSLLAEIASSPSAANQFVTDLNQLAKDLKSGNLSAAQQDYVTLSQDALNGSGSSTATTSSSGITTALLSDIAGSSSSAGSFVSDLNQLGTDLASSNLSSAQSDMLSLDSTALSAAPSSSTSAASSGSSSTSNQAEIAALIKATIQAMEAGDDSAIGTDMSQLASVSTSSQGASYLESESASYGSGSSSTSIPGLSSSSSSSASSLSQLLASLNTDSSSSSNSSLSLLA
jgi:hypothetical protein